MAKIFLDTNILVYTLDNHSPVKRDSCRALLRRLEESGQGVISTQVMQEFYVATTTKLAVDHLIAKKILRSFENFEVIVIDPRLIQEAADCCTLNKISFWDALIVVSAKRANSEKIWTEDLNPGQIIAGVLIENPLKPI